MFLTSDESHARELAKQLQDRNAERQQVEASIRETLGFALRRAGYQVETFPDGQAAWEAFQRTLPGLVVLDILMPRLDGVGATRLVRQQYPGVAVVALTSFSEAERVHAALEAGAAGYLLKDAEADELAAAIRAAYRGEVHLDPAVARKLTQSLVAPAHTISALTAREREVLVLVAKGQSNHEIADALLISERTARTHVSNILSKLGLPSRTQAALWAVREGLAVGP